MNRKYNFDSSSDSSDHDGNFKRIKRHSNELQIEACDATDKKISMKFPKQLVSLLINRKPKEAYILLQDELANASEYEEHLINMALEWFTVLLHNENNNDVKFSVFDYVHGFQNVIRDVIRHGISDSNFWEKVIHNAYKFLAHIEEAELIALLRRLIVNDIRDYLNVINIKVSIETTNFILDQKLIFESHKLYD
jgi:hypothetical protein